MKFLYGMCDLSREFVIELFNCFNITYLAMYLLSESD